MSAALIQRKGVASGLRDTPIQSRAGALVPSTFDDAESTVDVVFAAGAAVLRRDWDSGQRYEEALEISAGAIDLERIEAGVVHVLDNHDLYTSVRSVLGIVVRAWVAEGKAFATLKLSSDPAKAGVVADIKAGVIRAVSVGYSVQRYEVDDSAEPPRWTATRWMPQELSFVTVPADAGASTRSAPTQRVEPCEFTTRGAKTPNLEPSMNQIDTTERAAEISDLCTRHAVGHMTAALIRGNKPLSEVKDEIMTAIAVRDAAGGHHQNTRGAPAGDAAEASRELITNTLAARMGVRVKGAVLGSVDCVGLAARSLSLGGVQVNDAWSRSEIVQRAMGMHSTGDFPALLGSAARRVLHDAYEAAPVALKLLARRIDATDFRERSIVRMSSAPSLEKVNEHGEFKYGSASEASASWKLDTYGRIIGLTRQAMVNDDLGGFADLLGKFGDAAARKEADLLYAVLTTPPTIDGVALFSAARSSLVVDALDIEGLGAAVVALRKQRDIGGALVAQEPAYMVVPAALEMRARQLVASFTAMQAGDVQPFSLKVAVEPRLDAVSATAWYLVAARQSALEYGYLDGNEGVQITQREGFEVDGIEIKARLDFGCGWGAPLGWVKSNGDDVAL